jgi:hypothetical protein
VAAHPHLGNKSPHGDGRGEHFRIQVVPAAGRAYARTSTLVSCKSLARPPASRTALRLQLQPEASRLPQFNSLHGSVPRHFVRRGTLNLSAGGSPRLAHASSRRARMIACHNAQAWPAAPRLACFCLSLSVTVVHARYLYKVARVNNPGRPGRQDHQGRGSIVVN